MVPIYMEKEAKGGGEKKGEAPIPWNKKKQIVKKGEGKKRQLPKKESHSFLGGKKTGRALGRKAPLLNVISIRRSEKGEAAVIIGLFRQERRKGGVIAHTSPNYASSVIPREESISKEDSRISLLLV